MNEVAAPGNRGRSCFEGMDLRRGFSIGGDWTGVYDYANGLADAVPFNATLFDIAGVVWGRTIEPNTFAAGFGSDLEADVNGSRSGHEVQFRKVYIGSPPGGDIAIEYAGIVSTDGTRIEGRWRIPLPGQSLEGPFVMDRPDGARAEATRTQAETVELVE